MRNYFPKGTSGAPLHTLSKLYNVPVGFVDPPSLLEAVNCFFRSPYGGCCSISDYSSCSDNEDVFTVPVMQNFISFPVLKRPYLCAVKFITEISLIVTLSVPQNNN